MLEPLSEHSLLLFWAQFTLLLIVARGLGYLFRRFGQPAVVGELTAGLLLGPSIFGRLLPDQAAWLFPGGGIESAPILTVAWIGVALLLVETGFDTDLALLRRLGRQAATVSVGSLVVPLVLGFAIGWVMPSEMFIGEAGTRVTFAAFIAVAMSISALPVVARILNELNLMRRSMAQVTVAAAMANDLVGWIMLGALIGIVTSGDLAIGRTLVTLAAIAAFIAFALTIGQRLADSALRRARQSSEGLAAPLTATLLVVLVAATTTQAIGVEAVLGAFIAGIVLGRSPYQRQQVRRTVELMSAAVFAPIFFATAGMYVDLAAVTTRDGLLWAVIIIAVASFTKLAGSYAGARLGHMPHSEGIAIGFGLNARGAMEIVLATIAFGIGVFSQDAYTIIVLMAMATSLAAPPLLRHRLRHMAPSGDEAERLEREETLTSSVVASTGRALLPTRGGRNSEIAADVLHLLLQPDATVTILTVHDPERPDHECRCDEALGSVAVRLDERGFERRRVNSSDPAAAILKEAELGYGLVSLGMTEEFRDTRELSGVLGQLLSRSQVPMVLVRHGTGSDVPVAHSRRILVPATGIRSGRAAEEVGAVLAGRLNAHLDLVHVVSRNDRAQEPGGGSPLGTLAPRSAETAAQSIIDKAVDRAARFGGDAAGVIRTGANSQESLLEAADELGTDLIVLSATARAVDGHPFLGHGTEYLLEHAPQTIIAVVFPPDTELGDGDEGASG